MMKIHISVPVYAAAPGTAVAALVGHLAWEDVTAWHAPMSRRAYGF